MREPKGFSARGVTPVGIYSCTSLRDPEAEQALRGALTTQTLLRVRSLRRDAHEKRDTCIAHSAQVCLSGDEM